MRFPTPPHLFAAAAGLLARAGALIAVLFCAGAFAYILPGSSILRRMADARDELALNVLRVDGSMTLWGQNARDVAGLLGVSLEQPSLEVDATFSFRVPGRCRLDVSVPNSPRLTFAQTRGRERVEGPGEVKLLAGALEWLCPLVAMRSSSEGEAKAAVVRFLQERGVQIPKTSLGRFSGQVAYVLGEVAPGAPQFWVYKDDFLPARLRAPGPGGVEWDLRLIDFSSPTTGGWFPRSLELWAGGDRVLRFTGLRADTRGNLTDKFF